MSDSLTALRGRWRTENVLEINQILDRYFPSRAMNRYDLTLPSVVGVCGGRRDLRGFPLQAAVNRYTVTGVDMSGITLHGHAQLGPVSSFENCLFVGADLRTNVCHEFLHSSFVRANLSRAVLGRLYEDCDFTRATLAYTLSGQATFRRCSFANARLTGAMLTHCRFEDCTFTGAVFGAGSMAGSHFVRSGVRPETLGNTIIDAVRFEE